ncbi:MAG: nickel pincer cofactor biosynthesis protein LarB, partial [Lentisphaerae bacterium]|nr:nickel pincer cofactor biosynthesis protein LarB [Lentisphaerota bacterium]
MDLIEILKSIETGNLDADEAARLIDAGYERDLGFAKLDLDRLRRRGLPEVIYGPGKTEEQLSEIVSAMTKAGQDVLITRATEGQFTTLITDYPNTEYRQTARMILVRNSPARELSGFVSVVCAGTSDLPVAEEAAFSAECAGSFVHRINDVGVAGLHRLMKHLPALKKSSAIVVVAGMEGALPSVIAGLLDKPIIAVPTSVGYGTGLNGIAALLAMLN